MIAEFPMDSGFRLFPHLLCWGHCWSILLLNFTPFSSEWGGGEETGVFHLTGMLGNKVGENILYILFCIFCLYKKKETWENVSVRSVLLAHVVVV